MSVTVVVPTLGRPSLQRLLGSLAASRGPLPDRVLLVDDRREPARSQQALRPALPGWTAERTEVIAGPSRGPAAARNAGWRAARTEWVAFLDDDVEVGDAWLDDLAADLKGCADDVAGSQGRIVVPLPRHRRPTDAERNTAGLETAQWITADIAYRRAVLQAVGGFDMRFPRAFREDADLGLRITAHGHHIARGRRTTTHPPRQGGWWFSVAHQRGNADDPLMRRLHGPGWGERAAAPPGRRPQHLATTAAAVATAAAALTGRRRTAAACGASWAALTGAFALRRIADGPRDIEEIARMLTTSAAIPPAATWHWLRGLWRHRAARPLLPADVRAVLFDRDGTLVRDVPYNRRPDLVEPMPGAREALDRLRARGIAVGVVTNQSGVARGILTAGDVAAVNARVEDLLGPFKAWQVCPHGPDDGCACRKPRPGMVRAAAAHLGVPASACVVIGDIAADVEAAAAAGATGVLVPNAATRREEIGAAPLAFDTLSEAVDALLGAAA